MQINCDIIECGKATISGIYNKTLYQVIEGKIDSTYVIIHGCFMLMMLII